MKSFVLLLLALAVPLAICAEESAKTTPAKAEKLVISSYRILPKVGHEKALEAALAAHAQKFHTADHAWRVGVVMSGPDEGMYHIVEGPTNWAGVDERGDLGDAHTKDYLDNIAPHVEKNLPNVYSSYQSELSSTPATQWTNKVLIEHVVVKPGRGSQTYDALKKWKAIAEKLQIPVAVWHVSFSGDDAYSVVFRLKDGFKVFDGPTPNFRGASAELYGPNEYARLDQADTDNLSRDWMELVEFKPELGSK
jgi:hypothetical protein